MEKILIIRFSSFGDVIQFLSVPSALKATFPGAEIHWLTRDDFAPLLSQQTQVDRVWTVERRDRGSLWRTLLALRREKFSRVYDGHNNLRSRLVTFGLLGPFAAWRGAAFIRRSKYRWRRLLLFKFRINLYPKPFPGQWSLIEPLKRWKVPVQLPAVPQLAVPKETVDWVVKLLQPERKSKHLVALAPSASYELKRWPIEYWRRLLELVPDVDFVILGGPEDAFLNSLVPIQPRRSEGLRLNLAGRLRLLESCAVVEVADLLVASDTGLLHVAEQLGKPCIAFMGPAPFGYPARPTTLIKERELPCRPCSKHGEKPCHNIQRQQCLMDIHPEEVAHDLQHWLQSGKISAAESM